MHKQQMMATMNKLVSRIREDNRIRLGKLCFDCSLSPSTVRGYIPVILDMYLDIKYSKGEFWVE